MKPKTKTNKTIILIKQIYEKISCIENMYNYETLSIESIPIYDDLFLDIYESLKNINVCLINFKNNSLLTDFDKIKVDLNKLNYTLRSIIILVYLNQCKNTDNQGLINFDNVFNLNGDQNYTFNDTSGCIILDEFKTINILNDKYLLIESPITFDFSETNLVFFKNKVDYIVETLIEDIHYNFKNIIKNIKINKKINEIKDERKILNNKYNNASDSSSSIGNELENILKNNEKKDVSNNFKEIKNYLKKTIFNDIFSNKIIFKFIHYLLIMIIFRFLLNFVNFF